MGSVGPEIGHRGADCSIDVGRVGVDVAGICDLTLGGRVDAVDLGTGELTQGRDIVFFGQGVDTRMLQELLTTLVD